jgi:hypothetical protein
MLRASLLVLSGTTPEALADRIRLVMTPVIRHT